ncbi:poly-beta-hydroxybutyrate polymerase N-terminal domain-containing protein, partial [Herbaspirillum frisingense]|uniref:poly-beta-hydroxybutyrate polymerase N-terminal domain-containing protein n=1 Tax=Herbaspirillum frisingense TaxID=92645 RepID=UPI0039AF5CEE
MPTPTERLDAQVHAALARSSGSLSLASGLLAAIDWAAHLAVSPGKRLELMCLALQQANRLLHYMGSAPAQAADLPVADPGVCPPGGARGARPQGGAGGRGGG